MTNEQPQQNREISGAGATGVGDDATNSPITTGDNNTVIQPGRDTIHAGRDVYISIAPIVKMIFAH